jgi:tetratricopeptide (TPR) repeat protein
MRLVILTLLLVATLSSYAQQNRPQPEPSLFDQARELYAAGKYDEALVLVNQLLSNNMISAATFDLKGSIYLDKGSADSALANFNAGLLLIPNDPTIYFHRAFAFSVMEMHDESIEDYNMAIKYVSGDSTKYAIIACRGMARIKKRDFQGAYVDYKMSVDFDSANVMAMVTLGTVLDNLGRGKEATMYFEKAVRLAPNEATTIGELGFHYMHEGDYKGAIKLFNRVLELLPDDAIAYNNMGYAKYKLNDLKGALKDIQRSITLDTQNSYAYRNRALVYLAMKQTGKACEDLHQAIHLGYTPLYGDDVQLLLEKHCLFKGQ